MMKDYFQGIDVDEHERRYRRYVRPLLDNFAKRAQDEGNANVFARRFSVKNPVDDLSTDRIAVYSENYRSKEDYRAKDARSVALTAYEEDIYWMMAVALGPKTARKTVFKDLLRLLGGCDVTLQYMPGHCEASAEHRYYSRTPEKADRTLVKKSLLTKLKGAVS